MTRHAPIPSLTVELAPVYRCGQRGKRAMTKRGAYMRAAWNAIIQVRIHQEEHGGHGLQPGDCDGVLMNWEADDDHMQCCRYHDDSYCQKVVPRLARWLRWRDGRRAAMAQTKER